MPELYAETALTPKKVAASTGFLDWDSQPSAFKRYPEFLFRYRISEHEALKAVRLARAVTSKTALGGRPYYRLNTPSAGNLHPVELYVQIRGVKGIISGIYHVDAKHDEIVLVREIGGDGLEHALGLANRFRGMLFLCSSVAFRSGWKYGLRAWRYCLLDAGHQFGALAAACAATQQELTILSGIDAECLNRVMGFTDEEHCVGAFAAGEEGTREAAPLKAPLMRVQPTDYCECDGRLASLIAQTPPCSDLPAGVYDGWDADALEAAIVGRRSAREFRGAALQKAQIERFMHFENEPSQHLAFISVVLRGDGVDPGIYRDGRLIRGGDFVREITERLVNQSVVAASSMVLLICSPYFNGHALMHAGFCAQKIYLLAHTLGIGCTGIGAYYDEALRTFVSTDMQVLYAVAIGVK
jgi:SagB-type dehydrogenase family enzyme